MDNDNDNNNDNIQKLIIKITNNIIDKKILEILKQISSSYPDKFLKNKIKLEYEFIKNNIKLINYTSNIKQTNILTSIIHKTSINDKNYIKKCKTENSNRCKARIWNNIYDRNTLKEISDIDKKFKVKDFIDIQIKEFHSKYILGTQCRKMKLENNSYCFQHQNHCPHGNYFEIPPKELCLHYMKDGNYM
jgi:hypothetical protein